MKRRSRGFSEHSRSSKASTLVSTNLKHQRNLQSRPVVGRRRSLRCGRSIRRARLRRGTPKRRTCSRFKYSFFTTYLRDVSPKSPIRTPSPCVLKSHERPRFPSSEPIREVASRPRTVERFKTESSNSVFRNSHGNARPTAAHRHQPHHVRMPARDLHGLRRVCERERDRQTDR